jgi:hypothetical protein
MHKLLERAKSPWIWFFSLIGLGTALSASSVAAEGRSVRLVPSNQVLPEVGCIPLVEKDASGNLTGKMACATEVQVREFCTAIVKR